MSLLLGINYELFGIMLADSRITFGTRPVTRMDGCAKFNFFTSAGFIGWCGDIDVVAHIMKILAPISIRADDPWIVMDESRLRHLVSDEVLQECPVGTAHIMIQLIQPLKPALGIVPQRTEMCVIDVKRSRTAWNWSYETVGAGQYRVRGSGEAIAPALDELNIALRVWTEPAQGRLDESAVVARCLMLEEVVSGKLKKVRPPGVGGLLQIGYVLNDRTRGVSYEKWVSCGDGYGTYARMAVEDGRLVQLHEPTGARYELLSPFTELGRMRSRAGEDFLSYLDSLGPDDPGVKRFKGKRLPPRRILVHPLSGAELTYRPLLIPRRTKD